MVSRSSRIGVACKPASLLLLGLGLILGTTVSGCGPSAPKMTEQEISKKADEHEAKSREMAEKYKKGPKGGHAGK